MEVLVTGITGYAGAALAPRLRAQGHRVRGFARDARRVRTAVDALVEGDAVTGAGLDAALDGVEVAYYLIHSMEAAAAGAFPDQEKRAAEHFAAAAADAGVRRIVYLGGLVPLEAPLSRHLGSRLAVEETLLGAVSELVALRASIVVAAGSRSFRFLVRLVERLPVLALPAWRHHRTRPIDGRDMIAFLERALDAPDVAGDRAWDIGGPDVVSYGELIAAIAEELMLPRPAVPLELSLTPIASVVAAAVAGEDPALIEPLMESLEHDLLPRDDDAAAAFGVRLHSLEAALRRALRDLERGGELAAR